MEDIKKDPNAKMNLLRETEQALKNHDLSFKQVKYISNKEGLIPIAEFEKAAQGLWYDDGYGEVMIDPTLRIVGKRSWWLERANYDGNEGWVFHRRQQPPTVIAGEFSLTTNRGNEDENILFKLEKNRRPDKVGWEEWCSHYALNRNLSPQEIRDLKKKIKENGGYCLNAKERITDAKCPCREFRERKHEGVCRCGLYEWLAEGRRRR